MLRVSGANAALAMNGSRVRPRNSISPPYPPLPSQVARANTRSNPISSARTASSALYSKVQEVARGAVEGVHAPL